jgi:hypothetical protein
MNISIIGMEEKLHQDEEICYFNRLNVEASVTLKTPSGDDECENLSSVAEQTRKCPSAKDKKSTKNVIKTLGFSPCACSMFVIASLCFLAKVSRIPLLPTRYHVAILERTLRTQNPKL